MGYGADGSPPLYPLSSPLTVGSACGLTQSVAVLRHRSSAPKKNLFLLTGFPLTRFSFHEVFLLMRLSCQKDANVVVYTAVQETCRRTWLVALVVTGYAQLDMKGKSVAWIGYRDCGRKLW